jgi:hypothetical protein
MEDIMTGTYTTRDEAIQREIVEPILAGDVDNIGDYDVQAIADQVLGDYSDGYACKVDVETFWRIVEASARMKTTYAVVAKCSYRDEVRRYDIPAVSESAARREAAERYGHESTIGVDTADVEITYCEAI